MKDLRHQLEARPVLPEHSAKKRKLNDGVSLKERSTQSSSSLQSAWTTDNFESVSFSVPVRKKCTLQISKNRKTEGVRAVAPGENSVPEFGLLWSQVDHVICLPVPEKAQPQKNFCILPKGGDGISPAGPTQTGENEESIILWTAPETKPKGAAEDEPTQAKRITEALLGAKCKIQVPDEKEFVSEVPPPGRKGKKAYHVKAFKGNKDGRYQETLSSSSTDPETTGYLFFLPQGIFWGFKKPLLLFSFPVIESISYTSILQRTFNLVISARASADAETQEHEFSMIDQADFAGIDGYVKRHGLQDSSLAETRRAKKYNVNGVKREDGVENVEEEGESELTKAHREAEIKADDDDDDEEDDNFDPGSEGESEGSGTSDDEDEEEGEGGEEAEAEEDDDDDAVEEVHMNDE